MKELSFQLYSARNFPPIEDILSMLAGIGYSQLETFGAQYDDPNIIAESADQHGLKIPSGHFSLQMLEENFGKVSEIAKQLGIELIICPYLEAGDRPDQSSGWSELGARLEKIAKRAAESSLKFAWHNHDFEFVPMSDGSLPMEIILDSAPGISWEADVAWIVRAGADPLDAITRHGSRISAVHVKDIANQGESEDEDGWADVGHGTMDWQGLLDSLTSTDCRYFIVEHDNPSDVERFAKRSFEAISSMLSKG